MTLLWFRSLWHTETSSECRYLNISASYRVIDLARNSGSPCPFLLFCVISALKLTGEFWSSTKVFTNDFTGWPSTRSMTRYIVCLVLLTKASTILITPWWFSWRSRWYSLSATLWYSSSRARITLTANFSRLSSYSGFFLWDVSTGEVFGVSSSSSLESFLYTILNRSMVCCVNSSD